MVTDSTSLYCTKMSATPISQFPSPATWLAWQNVGNLASFVFYFDFFTLTRQNVLYKMIFEIDFMSKIFYLTISDNPTVSKKKKYREHTILIHALFSEWNRFSTSSIIHLVSSLGRICWSSSATFSRMKDSVHRKLCDCQKYIYYN